MATQRVTPTRVPTPITMDEFDRHMGEADKARERAIILDVNTMTGDEIRKLRRQLATFAKEIA